MSLAKIAQHHAKMPEEGQIVLIPQLSIEEDDDFEPVIPLDFDVEEEEHEHKHKHEHEDDKEEKGTVIVKIDEDGDEDEVHMDGFAFLLPSVPGGDSQDDIEEEDENDLDVEEEEDIRVEEVDPWNWQDLGLSKFLSWLNVKLKSVPTHSGSDTTGLERAVAYLESLDRIISQAVRKDIKNELDIGKIENAREEIRKGVARLEDRLEKVNVNRYKKKKKKADEDQDGIVKEAQKIAGINGIVVTVPILISHCARVCINSSISHGRDIEETFKKLGDRFKLSMREKTELRQVISDMGYYVRDVAADFDKDFDPTSEDNLNMQANYPA